MSAQTEALRELLEQRFPGAIPVAKRGGEAAASGIPGVDSVLPGRGFPRGRLSVWAPGVGATAVLRSACLAAVERGERAAWIDAAGTLSFDVSWSNVVIVRPRGERNALLAAEDLLSSGGFAIVILSGVQSSGTARVRLCRAAREGNVAVVEISTEGHMAAVRLSSKVPRAGYHWRRNRLGDPLRVESVGVQVRATSLGWSREVEVTLPVANHALRLSLEPSLVSRRGATTG